MASVAACDDAPQRCHFGAEHAIFESRRGAFDEIQLLPQGDGALAVFSDANGMYVRLLDGRGLPRARTQRLAAGCNAGMAAAESGGQAWFACARRGPSAGEQGAVSVYTFDASGLQTRGTLGPVGPDSHGVGLDVRGESASVVWHDAAIGGAKVWYAELTNPAPRQLSEDSWYGSAPGLFALDGRRFALWAESRERDHAFDSRTQLLDLGTGKPVTVATGRDGAPSPDLVGGGNRLWLAFRDRRKPSRKTGLYLTRLAHDGRQTGPMVRVGRADGVGRPVLERCFDGLVAATPRTFAGDYFVGVVHVDPGLESLSAEQQFYEDSHEFAQVAAACLGEAANRMLLLIAERGRLGANRAALRSVGFSCQ